MMKNGYVIFIQKCMDMSTALYLFRSENFKSMHQLHHSCVCSGSIEFQACLYRLIVQKLHIP